MNMSAAGVVREHTLGDPRSRLKDHNSLTLIQCHHAISGHRSLQLMNGKTMRPCLRLDRWRGKSIVTIANQNGDIRMHRSSEYGCRIQVEDRLSA